MLHFLAKHALDELAALGVADVSPDEIAVLHEAALAVEAAERDGGIPSGSGLPVRLGAAVLWPLTCAGADFYNRAEGWFHDPFLLRCAMGYALAHGRRAGAFDDLAAPHETSQVMSNWFSNLGCTYLELKRAIKLVFLGERLNAADEAHEAAERLEAHLPLALSQAVRAALDEAFPAPAREVSQTWHQLVLDFCARTGCAPSDWMVEPSAEVARIYARILTAVPSSDSDEVVLPPALPEALREMRRIVFETKERRIVDR